jgi:hypothetical protein
MKGQISDLYDQMTGEQSGLEKLLNKIPGLSGYMEKGRRREADELLRQTVSSRLEEARLQLGAVSQELGRDIMKAIDHAESLGRVDTRLMGLIGKIKDAPQGYAGFFDSVKVKEDDLARIYAFDETMVNHADEIAAEVAALEKAVQDDGDVGAGIRHLDDLVREANTQFSSRDEVIKGIS